MLLYLYKICTQIAYVLLTVFRPVTDCFLTFWLHLFYGRTKNLPPITDQTLLMSAVKMAAKIRKRELSSEDVMRAYIQRVREVEPIINAVCDEQFDEAIKEAKAVDRFIASGVKSEDDIARDTPLLGVPFTCKEAIGVKGLSITCGLVARKGMKGTKDSDAAARYRKAGAIPYIVTNIPELCMWYESTNHIYGITNNPHNHVRTAGGSSGGEAAILAAGGAVIGIGNDIGGSIRIPSAFCGIYGHKPSTGVVSNKAEWPTEDICDCFVSTGPMCRYSEDLLPLMKILAGDDPKVNLDAKVDFRKLKVYYMESYGGFFTTPVASIRNAVRKAAKYFEETYGCQVQKLDIDDLKHCFRVWESKILERNPPSFKAAISSGGKEVNILWEVFKNALGCSEHTLPALHYASIEKREKDKMYYFGLDKFQDIEKAFDKLFVDQAIFFYPTHPEPPMHHHTTIPKFENAGYTALFNVLGLPSTQIPTGLDDGLPIGIQAISGKYQDHICLAVAAELEKVFNGWISPCPILV